MQTGVIGKRLPNDLQMGTLRPLPMRRQSESLGRMAAETFAANLKKV